MCVCVYGWQRERELHDEGGGGGGGNSSGDRRILHSPFEGVVDAFRKRPYSPLREDGGGRGNGGMRGARGSLSDRDSR